jgi:hypothetical protein
MIKELTFDAIEYIDYPYEYARRVISSEKNGAIKLEFNPYMYENEDGTKEKRQFRIQFNHISFVDWICTKIALENAGNDCEIGQFYCKEYRTIEELNEMTIPTAYAGEYISSSETIAGNKYNSNTDTYGSMMGNCAYNLYFLYVEGIEKYIVVTQEYLEL